MDVPAQPKIYHIAHCDRLASIVADGVLWCDAQVLTKVAACTMIGMDNIKQRRLTELTLTSHPDLHVGDCVPFYFCPRSIMLYIIYQANHPDISYRGGQEDIIHLQADLLATVNWANARQRRWAFTLSNAGSYFFEDRNNLAQLDEINWRAVETSQWVGCKDGKQAEFLIEDSFPWQLIERIGVQSRRVYQQVVSIIGNTGHQTPVELKPDWYY